ncbi:hypothetical protein AMS68_002384 [Peltaster fructicola]|uniref:Uncharacterized protein n=1 Tax=Peltaster fructicola TaxID=286661 RepID=A0A6H0XQ37_9PEZI|nr:hypothetical protein AMS68_002384 [Peltaster fructicola]
MTSLARVLHIASLATTAFANTLPYNPSKIFLPSNSSFAYIFDSTSQDDGSTRLLSLDLSKQVDTSSITLNTLNNTVVAGGLARSIIQDTNGNLISISGNCTAGASTTQVWTFVPNKQDTAGNGSWTQNAVTGQQTVGFLANGMAFSSQSNAATSNLYLFAGMCPAAATTTSTWTSNATYSANMLKLVSSNSNGVVDYTESTTISSGGPVAEAGFSVTGLPRSGQGNSIQQQFVMIGGHTQSAFINMSQVAIFSLPQESWTFLPIQQTSAVTVEPRSGHTAVLTKDGSKIVVLGGWVGDISSPAQPQLAVLDIGAGYGGSGEWQWTTPSLSGSGLSANAGLFGHGAAMLSDDIMLVYGGYQISGTSANSKRALSQAQPLLFNVSSSQWISSYNVPVSTNTQTPASSGGSSPSGQTIGLAVGLSIGALILIALVIFYFWYTRRAKRKHQEAERHLTSRSSDGSYAHISQPFLEKNSIDERGGDMSALSHPWLNPDNIQPMVQHGSATGAFMDNPSPTRGLRKGVPARGYSYHAAPRYDEKRASRHSGNIHPIAEDDEVSMAGDHMLSEAERQLKEVAAILNSNRTPERARDFPNPLRSHPVSPEVGDSRHVSASARSGSPNWTIEPDEMTTRSGRVSPTKTDDRTSSSLSERSHRSFFSDNSITRTMSTRTGALLAAAAAAAHVRGKAVEVETQSEVRTDTMSTFGRTSPVSRRTVARSSTNGSSSASEPKSAGAYAESFHTARSKAAKHEGDALYGGQDYDDPYGRALAADNNTMPSLQYGPTRRRQGILGSLRKAIGVIAATDRTMSLTSRGNTYDQLPSTNSSPTKERRNPVDNVRRTVSDGGALLRQKRGRHDWADGAWPPYHDDPDPGDWGEHGRTSLEKKQAEEEWDVEDAAGKRDVQIMFTVPKSRLRVVNADMDRASLRSVSDGALSRAGSMRVVRREESRNALNATEKLASMPEVEGDDKDKTS